MSDPSALSAEALAAIAKARTEAELEQITVEYLGRKSASTRERFARRDAGQLPG